MIAKFARLEFELFTRPSKSDFLRVCQASISSDHFITIFHSFENMETGDSIFQQTRNRIPPETDSSEIYKLKKSLEAGGD